MKRSTILDNGCGNVRSSTFTDLRSDIACSDNFHSFLHRAQCLFAEHIRHQWNCNFFCQRQPGPPPESPATNGAVAEPCSWLVATRRADRHRATTICRQVRAGRPRSQQITRAMDVEIFLIFSERLLGKEPLNRVLDVGPLFLLFTSGVAVAQYYQVDTVR